MAPGWRRDGAGMAHWHEALVATMFRNAGSVADFFRLPHNCTVELNTHVQIGARVRVPVHQALFANPPLNVHC